MEGVSRPVLPHSVAPTGFRALVVDDDLLIRELLAALLRDRGYAVETAEDGAMALERMAMADFQLVVTDRSMPRMDGLALCRAIRARGAAGYVYCIMLTASSDEASLVEAMQAGADDFVGKPLQPAELGARLNAAERVLQLEAGLARRNRELADAYGVLSRELETARAMQRGLLPPPADVSGVRADWLLQASSYVGGDTLGYVPLDDRHLCFYMVDVSGHGVTAAMLAISAQHQLFGLARGRGAAMVGRGEGIVETAGALVTEFNRRAMHIAIPDAYLTLVFGLIDTQAGEAAVVHAGHPPVLVAGPGEARFEAVGEGDLPIGILADVQWQARRLAMPAGTRLVVHSDGVTECRSASGEAFGEDRLRELLAAQRAAPLGDTLQAVARGLSAWRAEPQFEDDVTVLALEMR